MDTIIALEESGGAELQETQGTSSRKNSIRPGLGGRCSTKNDGEAVRDEEKRLISR